ncbi:MAG: methyltransferase [Bacteroidota bacterium]
MMKNYLRKISAKFLYPIFRRYQRRERRWKHGDIVVKIFPGVFHPGLFFSTRFMMEYLSTLELHHKRIHELGAGSGFLSVYCAKAGADVTASDINPSAVKNITENAAINHVDITVLQSDLYMNIPLQQFDIIIINPPYYIKKPANMDERAWFCGEDAEYFRGLFSSIRPYLNDDTQVLMVLSEDCRTDIISEIGSANGFSLNLQKTKKLITERNYIFRVSNKQTNA